MIVGLNSDGNVAFGVSHDRWSMDPGSYHRFVYRVGTEVTVQASATAIDGATMVAWMTGPDYARHLSPFARTRTISIEAAGQPLEFQLEGAPRAVESLLACVQAELESRPTFTQRIIEMFRLPSARRSSSSADRRRPARPGPFLPQVPMPGSSAMSLPTIADPRQRVRPVADQRRALDRRADLAVLDQVGLGAGEHELARGDVHLPAAERLGEQAALHGGRISSGSWSPPSMYGVGHARHRDVGVGLPSTVAGGRACPSAWRSAGPACSRRGCRPRSAWSTTTAFPRRRR